MNPADLLSQILGPYGALVVESIVIFFLYRMLLREQVRTAKVDEQAENMIALLNEVVTWQKLRDERDKWERRQ